MLFLKPEKANVFDGIVGFQPDAKTVKWLTVMAFRFGKHHWTRRRSAFNWQQLQDQTQQIDAMAKAPYLFKTLGFGSIYIYRKDSSFNNVEQRLLFL